MLKVMQLVSGRAGLGTLVSLTQSHCHRSDRRGTPRAIQLHKTLWFLIDSNLGLPGNSVGKTCSHGRLLKAKWSMTDKASWFGTQET